MLEGLLLIDRTMSLGIRVQAHAPSDTALTDTMLGIDDRVTARSSVGDLRILLLEDGEVALGFPVEDAVRGEEEVHLLKGALAGLGVESPDHGEGDDVAGAEDVVSLFAERFEHDGAEETQPSVTDGPAHDTPRVTLRTDFQRENFGRVQPWNSKPGSAENECEDVDHGDGGVTVTSGFVDLAAVAGVQTEAGERASEEHSNALSHGSPVECIATTNTVKCEDTDKGGELVEC